MNNWQKKRLSALLAVVMIVTSVMPAIAEMDTEVLDFVETVEEADLNEFVENTSEETVTEAATEHVEETKEVPAEITESQAVEVPVVDTVIEASEVTTEVVSPGTEVVTGTLQEIGEAAIDGVTVEEVVEVTEGKQGGASVEIVENASGQTVISNREVIIDGVRITITAEEGVFPEGAELSVRKITDEEKEKTIDEAIEKIRPEDEAGTVSAVVTSLKFDVKMLVTNPATGEKESVQPDTGKGKAEISFTYDEVMSEQTKISIYHMKEEGDAFTAEKLDTELKAPETENTETGEALLGASAEEETEVTDDGEEITIVKRTAETVRASAEITGFSDYVIETEKSVTTIVPQRPVWIMSHKCNSRGEITGEYGHLDGNVKDSGCNAIEVDITYSNTPTLRYGADPTRKRFVGDHNYDEYEQIFCTHSSSIIEEKSDDWYSLMTLSELFHDVREIFPQISIIYLDIKRPECMPILNKEVHSCLQYYFNNVQMPYIVYSVAEPESIFNFRWWGTDGKQHTIDLWANEGVCCDMDSDIAKIVANFDAVGLDKVWVGNGTPLDTWDPIKEAGIHKAVELRDDTRSLSIIKKVEYWTAARQGSVETELIDDDGWLCDSVMIADCVRDNADKMTSLLKQIDDSARIRYATIADDPFQVSKTTYEMLFVYYDEKGNKIEELRRYPAGTPYTPPNAPNVPTKDLNCDGWKVFDQSGIETSMDRTAVRPLFFRMQYTDDEGYTLRFESNGGSYVPDCHVSKSKPQSYYYEPDAPVKDGHYFEGWYDNPGFAGKPVFSIGTWLSDWEIHSDLTVYAKWSKRDFYVNFEYSMGEGIVGVDSFRVYYGEMPTPPEENPTKEGYDFVKWEPDLTPVKGDQTYKAKFVSQEKVTITFNTMGGAEIAPLIGPKGEIPDFSDVYTERTGYEFLGFFYDKEYTKKFIDYEAPLKESLTLYAKWESLYPTYTVTWVIDGEEETTDVQEGRIPYHNDPYKEGYIFTGWNPQPEPAVQDVTYTAKFIRNAETVVVSFNTDGGNYIAPQQISKGGNAVMPDTPVKRGYRFLGWYKEAAFKNPFDFSSDAVNESVTLYAKWEPVQYTIRWYNEDRTELLTTTKNYVGELPAFPEDQKSLLEKEGYVHTGWTPDVTIIRGGDGPVTADTPIEEIVYQAMYQPVTPGERIVYFDGKGGTVTPETVEVQYTGANPGYISAAPAKEKEGAVFAGWKVNDPKDTKVYTDAELLKYPIDRDGIVFSAEWNLKDYEITWDYNGGTDTAGNTKKTESMKYGDMPVSEEPVREGYIFTGWDPTPVPVTKDSTYKAKYMAQTKEKVAVSFNTMGGSFIGAQIVASGSTATKPAKDPVMYGYTFTGWFADEKCTDEKKFDFGTLITQDTTVYAGWKENVYEVKWTKDGKEITTTYSKYKELPVFPENMENDLKKDGYVHIGWNPSVTVIDELSKTVITYEAVYTESMEGRYVVSFDSQGSSVVEPAYVIKGQTVAVPEEPVRAGYSFGGWCKADGTLYNFTTPVNSDLNLIAKWTPLKYAIVWKDGETVLKTQYVEYDSLPEFGTNPEKEGYYFAGWDPSVKTVSGDAIYQAIFLEKGKEVFVVSFNSNGGTHVAVQKIEKGATATKPAKPAKGGYTFVGWYLDGKFTTEYRFTEAVTADITLYAKWKYNSSGSGGGGGSVGGGSVGSGVGGTVKAGTQISAGATFSPNWYVDPFGVWRIHNSKGQTVTDSWLCDDAVTINGQNVWYLLRQDGAMLAAGLVQDNTGNFYSLETAHNGYFGMLRYKDGYYNCNGQQVYLTFNREHNGSFGAITNAEGLEKLKTIYGITKYGIGNENSVYTASF